ncbi:hypothetical protein [Streptomyces mirabilis]|uniref:hypothetical protein n=1 Tax=Streptomyces mirabilis TaxID=68239 RepID=UPI0033EB2C81
MRSHRFHGGLRQLAEDGHLYRLVRLVSWSTSSLPVFAPLAAGRRPRAERQAAEAHIPWACLTVTSRRLVRRRRCTEAVPTTLATLA